MRRTAVVTLVALASGSAAWAGEARAVQVVNQVVEDAESAEPGATAESPEQLHAGSGSAILVDGVSVETKADPPCWPSLDDPDQDHRFIDCDNGTVHDTVTGLIWLKNANCFECADVSCPPEDGKRDWFEAVAFAADLAAPQCGLTDHSQKGDWRLPTSDEWLAVNEAGSVCDAPRIAGKAGGCYSDTGGDWAVSVPSDFLWSSSSSPASPDRAWVVGLDAVSFSPFFAKTITFHVWPVRGGQ